MKKNIIIVHKDASCEMAMVTLNGDCIMCGNYWDFHPGCHGITKYGDFNSPGTLASAVQIKTGVSNTVIKFDNNWKWEY